MKSTIIDRHMLSNLPAINVRIIQILFIIEYDIKENNIKQTTVTHNNIDNNIMCDSTSHCNCPYLL
jgi:hypothetical protein